MTTITAKTILRSRHAQAPDKVLSTLLLRYPRCIHAEQLTHRVFSKNSASSRAIPVEKMIQAILDDPFVPVVWGKNQKGMQADEECNEQVRWIHRRDVITIPRETAWLNAMEHAIRAARAFSEAGYHKQIVNRLLEPFMHITIVLSSTEWHNFLELRDDPAAEPHIQILARAVRACLDDEETIQTLQPGEWHLPFVTDVRGWTEPGELAGAATTLARAVKLSTALCASTSYKTVDGFDMTDERAYELHDRLIGSKPFHASPLEHVAQADGVEHWDNYDGEGSATASWQNRSLHRNFVGFNQYRAIIGA